MAEIKGDPRFHQLLQEMAALHEKKAADYGDREEPLANIRSSTNLGIPPWKGVLLRMNDKMTRLNSFAKKGSLQNELMEDSLVDLAAYALLCLVVYREDR